MLKQKIFNQQNLTICKYYATCLSLICFLSSPLVFKLNAVTIKKMQLEICTWNSQIIFKWHFQNEGRITEHMQFPIICNFLTPQSISWNFMGINLRFWCICKLRKETADKCCCGTCLDNSQSTFNFYFSLSFCNPDIYFVTLWDPFQCVNWWSNPRAVFHPSGKLKKKKNKKQKE